MPENKKHHYVPHFYLKRFSRSGKSINIWNLKSERKILSANLKNQCYREYFYGKVADVEKALGDVEGRAAQVFRQVDIDGELPAHGTADYLVLILYVLMQYGRTAYSADRLNEMADNMMKHLIGPKAEEDGVDIKGFKIGIKDPARFSLGVTTQNYPLILDLQCKLLVNECGIDFVTSDNPVVFYNQLMSFRKFGSNTGFVSKGLQIFFPISPTKQLMFFDPAVYGVGNQNMSVITLNKPRDIYEINTLQACSAAENIYFTDESFDVEALYRKAKPFMRRKMSDFNVFPKHENKFERRELVVSSSVDVRTNLILSFTHLKVSAKKWRNEFQKLNMQPALVARDPVLVEDHREFRQKVEDGEYRARDFIRFVNEKYAMD